MYADSALDPVLDTTMDLSTNTLPVPVPVQLDSLLFQSLQVQQQTSQHQHLSNIVTGGPGHHPDSGYDFSQSHPDDEDPNAHLMSAIAGGGSGLPMSDFTRAREAILEEHIPRVQRLAKRVIVGITHAYEPGMDASRTAGDLADLRSAFTILQQILSESGVGALPIDPASLNNRASTPAPAAPISTSTSTSISNPVGGGTTESPSQTGGVTQDQSASGVPPATSTVVPGEVQVGDSEEGVLDERIATRRVEEAFARVKRRKDAVEVALNILEWST